MHNRRALGILSFLLNLLIDIAITMKEEKKRLRVFCIGKSKSSCNCIIWSKKAWYHRSI